MLSFAIYTSCYRKAIKNHPDVSDVTSIVEKAAHWFMSYSKDIFGLLNLSTLAVLRDQT